MRRTGNYMTAAIQTVKDMLTMKEVVRFYGIEVDRSGFANCPFHNERTGSFKIFSDTDKAHCFGCGWHGDIISFASDYLHTDSTGAVKALVHDFHLPISLDKPMSVSERSKLDARVLEIVKERRRKAKERAAAEQAYDEALDLYAMYDIWRTHYSPESRPYIEAVRNIGSAAYAVDLAERRLDMCDN